MTADFAPTIAPRPTCTWPVDAGLPGHHHVVVDRRAAGDADLRREQHVAADLHAVRDLHEVVDLGAGRDARLADRRTIDRRVRADLDVVFDDDAADLRNLQVRAVRPAREAEAVAADHGAVVHDDAVRRARRARESTRASGCTQSSPIVAPAPIDDMRMDDRARADRRAGADDDERRRSTTSGPSVGGGSIAASALMPGAGRAGGVSSATASANARYGSARAQHRARRGR